MIFWAFGHDLLYGVLKIVLKSSVFVRKSAELVLNMSWSTTFYLLPWSSGHSDLGGEDYLLIGLWAEGVKKYLNILYKCMG